MSDQINLKGKVVVLTGGTGLLGKYFSKALREVGAKVVVTDIVGEFDEYMDVTSQKSIDKVLEQVMEEEGRIDVVINNAAIDPKFDQGADHNAIHFEVYPEAAMKQSIEVNMLGTWRVCKSAVRLMKKQGGGNIVNMASFYGVTPPRQDIYPVGKEKPVDYPMTKAAIIMLTRQIASQFGSDGIRCNALAPGGVVNKHEDKFKQAYAAHTSLGKMSEPDEITDALLFLAGSQSKGMTGEVLVVDAGWRSR